MAKTKKETENAFAFIVIGAGGTGSLFMCDFARYLSTASQTVRNNTAVILCDGDIVEDKNRARQIFFPEDIGQGKASCLASSLNDAFDLEILSKDEYITAPIDVETMITTATHQIHTRKGLNSRKVIPVVISCVDNVHARKQMEAVFNAHSSIIYIDSGNGFSNGQCLYAVKDEGIVYSPLRDFYGFLYEDEDMRPRTEMSCAELNQVAPQHLLTNRFAALNILRAAILLLEKKEILRGITSFDAFAGFSSTEKPEHYGFKATRKKTS